MKSSTRNTLFLLLCAVILPESIFSQDTNNESIYKNNIVIAGDYQLSGFAKFFAGEHWRDLWITPIKVPVLNLNNFAGGITPTKKGGGQQTKSLHFVGNDGKEYKFRSIDKDVRRSLPVDFRESIIADLMQDQVSVINPASAVVVAPLMDAVGILNTKPTIYLMPDDRRLEKFKEEFAGVLGTIEEDPEEYEDESLNFAGADKVFGTIKMYETLQKDNDERVDGVEFLKARLFDIFIGDRDRHAGQWNWAGYKNGKHRIWKPIPKDRDFAFPLYDGVIPTVMTVAMTSLVNFGYDMPSMLDMTWEGRHLDRRLLSSLDKPIWDSVALFMQENLTDSVIENAVLKLPLEYYGLEGEHLISKLKSRRDQIKKASDEFYYLLAKYVDVYCSDKNEYTEINRINNKTTEVTVFKRDKKTGGKKGSPLFYRLLDNEITDDIRVHLLGGDDVAIVSGNVEQGPKVILVGGKGKDELVDSSRVEGFFLGITTFRSAKTKTEFYDSGNKTIFIEGDGTYINTKKYKEPKEPQQKYEPTGEDRFRDYSILFPFEYNSDDGLVIGIGGRVNYYDFRKVPFAHRYFLSGSYATKSQRAEFSFLGDFNDMIEGMNVKIPAKYTGLEITRFYGFGNETVKEDSLAEIDYYDVNQRYFGVGFNLNIPLADNLEFHTGLLFEIATVLKKKNRLVTEINPYGMGTLDFLVLTSQLKFDNKDDRELPFKGYYFDLYADVYPPTINNKDIFGKVSLDGRTYLSAKYITDFTLALRTYGEVVWGEYPFYKGASIGGSKTLRGFSRERYVGDAALFGSIELRYFLANVYFLVPFKLGMNLFTDGGRVFYKEGDSSKWHTAFGGGFWFSIYNRAINFSINLAKSPEDIRIYLNIGQMF